MLPASISNLLSGPFNFLRNEPEEIIRLFPDAERVLPVPQYIFLDDEAATPLVGFPILATRELTALEQAIEAYLQQEEEVALAVQLHSSFDSTAYAAAWERFRLLVTRAAENVTTASYGRHYPTIFWLYLSVVFARTLKDTPKRILRRDLTLGRDHGETIKYRVFQKVVDRVVNLTYDLVNRLASETEEAEEQLFPTLITRMRDNILVFTEDHVSPNLQELSSYFAGCLHIDGREFRSRLVAVGEWYRERLRSDPALANVASLLSLDPHDEPRRHLTRSGFLTYVASRSDYDREKLLPPHWIQMWESLLTKLKEFEVLHALRRSMIPVERSGERFVARDRGFGRTSSSRPGQVLSGSTRPLDFMAPWVVDPLVSRFGLIYDITEFTETVSMLRRSGSLEQDRSFRMMFRFQRRVNRMAASNRAKLEKYLGDGAFFSSREAKNLLVLAIQIQRSYREALLRGFPFSKGLRIALNHGQYRLLPVQIGPAGDPGRYEFFGHGVVELTRLTTGKAGREIEEIKNLLVTRGYPETTVNRFFAPMTQQNVEVVDKREQARGFYAYIGESGTLVNEGIVATGDFISRLAAEGSYDRVFRLADGNRSYIAIRLEAQPSNLLVGLRKLGTAHLKGLDRLGVYEIVDAALWGDNTLMELRGGDLLEMVEKEFAASIDG